MNGVGHGGFPFSKGAGVSPPQRLTASTLAGAFRVASLINALRRGFWQGTSGLQAPARARTSCVSENNTLTGKIILCKLKVIC
jgi:hypothetical protein